MSRVRITRQDGTARVVEVSRTGKVKSDMPACPTCNGSGVAPLPETCSKHGPRGLAQCGDCLRSWCYDCYPTPASLCPFCNGDERAAAKHEYWPFGPSYERE